MNKLILCEGKTDAALLGYYLGKIAGWQECKKVPKGLKIKPTASNQSVNWYQKDKDSLLICVAGGNTNFKNFIEKTIMNPLKDGSFKKIAFVLDRDVRETREIEDFASSVLEGLSTTVRLQNNNWVKCYYKNRFKKNQCFEVLLVVVPKKGQGALETLMLKAISENADKRRIVDKTRSFVERIRKEEASSYITNDSLELKAHWGLTWAVLSPETIFMPFNKQIEKVPWEQSQTLQNCFSELIKI